MEEKEFSSFGAELKDNNRTLIKTIIKSNTGQIKTGISVNISQDNMEPQPKFIIKKKTTST